MKKIVLVLALFASFSIVKAQDSLSTKTSKSKTKFDLSNRANDHFMLQYGMDGWSGTNDSINPSGFSRHFNVYFMLDKPFKTNPHYSVGFGLGVGSSNMFFKNTYIDLKSRSAQLPFTDVSAENHFKKYKLTTIFLELPVELRYVSNPETPDKGVKASIGAKVGTLLSAHTKGKDLQNKSGSSVYDNKYIAKESDKKFINSTRLAVTARLGFGNFSIDGAYQITNFLKDGAGPQIKPYSIGLTISGL